MRILIKGGQVIDPANQINQVADILIEDGRIVGLDIAPSVPADKTINATGKIVAPGLIDMHVHLREPGREEDETIETGTAAALAGGFSSIACIPNTEPPSDSQAAVEFIRERAERANNCNVFVVGCISQNRQGKELAEIGQLVESGAVAFSDDGSPVADAELMRRALQYCLMFDKPILSHAEVPELTKGGVMHDGLTSMILGLGTIPAAAEDVMTSRDIALAEATGGRLHMMHVSTKGSVDAIRRAKARKIRISAEVTPHHFSLTDRTLRSFDSNYKMSPPLRGQSHLDACIEGLVDGTIDCIATDHAPHAREKKMQVLNEAPFGIIGLETALGLVSSKLVVPGHLSWAQAIEKMTINPARVLGIDRGTLSSGAVADITIIDPNENWTVDPTQFRSKSTNSPFVGWELTGRAVGTIVDGKVRFER
jgi:dihydroorotase